jgi:flagellar basal-body rod protein FlgB
MKMAKLFSTDGTMNIAKAALNGLARRQEVVAKNLANIDTPGYQSQRVNFEDALRRVRREGGDLNLMLTNDEHVSGLHAGTAFQVSARRGGTARADGNNVDIDVELMETAETGIRFQTLTQSVSKKLLLLKTIASGR